MCITTGSLTGLSKKLRDKCKNKGIASLEYLKKSLKHVLKRLLFIPVRRHEKSMPVLI